VAALQIISLETTTPQLRAPASGDTYSAPRALDITPETLTGSSATSSLSIAQTWNTTGTPTALSVAVTDTASNSLSLLASLSVGANVIFRVGKTGATRIFGTIPQLFLVNTSFVDRVALGEAFIDGASRGVVSVDSGGYFAFGGAGASLSGPDLRLARDAANTLALRNGVNAQTFRWYQRFTDASNYTRGQVSAASDIVTLSGESAGTGAANIDVAITPKGTGRVRYGTHSAIGAETVTGYIEIKDAGGTVRKLAVVS